MGIDDAELDALIRASRLGREPHEFAVAPESVHAYLSGTATAEQKLEVRRALARSAAFRRELMEVAGYLESLAQGPAAPARDASASTERTAPWSFINWLGESATRVMRSLGDLSPRWVALAPVAALVAMVIVIPVAREQRFAALMPAGTQILDARELAGDTGTPRGEPTTHLEALLGALQESFVDRGEYGFSAPGVPAEFEFPVDLTIRLVDDRGAKVHTVHARPAPGAHAVAPGAAIAWIVTLQPGDDELHIQSFPVTRRHFKLPIVAQVPAVLAVTVADGGHFRASPCWRLPGATAR